MGLICTRKGAPQDILHPSEPLGQSQDLKETKVQNVPLGTHLRKFWGQILQEVELCGFLKAQHIYVRISTFFQESFSSAI
jgi:hypothetical protein